MTPVETKEATDRQRRLYRLNRSVLDAEDYAELLALERAWLTPRIEAVFASMPALKTRKDLFSALDKLLETEAAQQPELERWLAEEASIKQFKIVVSEFAVDGLVESQSHLGIIPRLPPRARMAVFRVLIDEFGCGNDKQEHSQLYRHLVAELGMPADVNHYVDRVNPESLAYVNLFHWLASRAPSPGYFVGAYAYFESSVLYAFQCYARAAERLGITGRAYYTEHLFIDDFHRRGMRSALAALDAEGGLDVVAAWTGVALTSAIVAEATEAALAKAKANPA